MDKSVDACEWSTRSKPCYPIFLRVLHEKATLCQ